MAYACRYSDHNFVLNFLQQSSAEVVITTQVGCEMHMEMAYGASATGGTGCILTVLHTLRGMHTRSWVLLDGVGSS